MVTHAMGRNHAAPKEYTYFVKFFNGMDMCVFNNEDMLGNESNTYGVPIFETGYNTIRGIDVWIVNQEKQGHQYFWFKSRADGEKLEDILKQERLARQQGKKNTLYKFTKHGWTETGGYDFRYESELIGENNQRYLATISKDMENYAKYTDFLKTIGEGSRSLNYLLMGPPGTGKTTFIKILGSKYNYPAYVVNAAAMKLGQYDISYVLNPSGRDKKIVLFEDFDRYLQEGNFNMSDILNCLDGIESSNNCIRFFTANNTEVIQNFDALVNRLNATFLFGYPTAEHFRAKLLKLLSFHAPRTFAEEDVDTLISKVEGRDITLRPFTNFVIRYLFDENVMELLLKNVESLYALYV